MNVYYCTPKNTVEEVKSVPSNVISSDESFSNIARGVFSNKESIASVYNNLIEKHKDSNEPLVLLHDDVQVIDSDAEAKIKKALEVYDVVGLAGGAQAKIVHPCLWHIMCPKDTYRGSVYHMHEQGTYETKFGPQGRVLILDGLFLAFNPSKIYKIGTRFDESCPSKFHFYDIDFCLSCNNNKLLMGTTDVKVVHNSPGLRSFTPDWLGGQEWFINKWTP